MEQKPPVGPLTFGHALEMLVASGPDARIWRVDTAKLAGQPIGYAPLDKIGGFPAHLFVVTPDIGKVVWDPTSSAVLAGNWWFGESGCAPVTG